MKRILILGAANDQLPLILKSKELGYYVIVCDRTTTNPGLKFVDKHYQVDYMDRETILKIAKEEQIDGVISNSELVMQNVAYVCEALGLRGNSLESIRNLGEKDLFRKLQKDAGVFAPKQADVSSEEEAVEAIRDMKLPVLIKPCRNSASRGIFKIEYFDESLIKKSFADSLKNSWNQNVSIEEFVEMPSMTVIEGDIFIYDGKILWEGLFHNLRSPLAPMVPMTDISPLFLSQEKYRLMQESVARIFRVANIRFGSFNIEMYFNSTGDLFVIEINTRQGGVGVPKYIEEYTGIDYSKLLVSLCVDDYSYCDILRQAKFKIAKNLTRHVVFARRDGVFDELYIDDEIKKYITNIEMIASNGVCVKKCQNGTDAIARVDLEFSSFEEQQKYAYDIENYIYPRLR